MSIHCLVFNTFYNNKKIKIKEKHKNDYLITPIEDFDTHRIYGHKTWNVKHPTKVYYSDFKFI